MRGRMDRQGGWVGLVAMLLALAIVAWLAKDALKSYGLMAPATTTVKPGAATPGAGTTQERAPTPGAVEASSATIESSVPVPGNAMDRARGVEGMLKGQEGKRAGSN